jgi:hypothetical protein
MTQSRLAGQSRASGSRSGAAPRSPTVAPRVTISWQTTMGGSASGRGERRRVDRDMSASPSMSWGSTPPPSARLAPEGQDVALSPAGRPRALDPPPGGGPRLSVMATTLAMSASSSRRASTRARAIAPVGSTRWRRPR